MNKISKLLLTAGLTIGTVLATPKCSSKLTGPVETTLLGYKPVQCVQTPWEADSLSVLEYYAEQGIDIFWAMPARTFPTCAACGCPRGYTLVAEVAEKDTLALMNDGFFHYDPKRN
ncbi:hypothetical protein HYT23_05945 [Candidatus Pacearchaeota archaeon]|nr:hypothetical protein [Candidatus Pacearchaeota archaeon]